MNGAFLIDKPAGVTSMDVIRKMRQLLDLKRIGHGGTLDPLASGLLVLLCGKATKLQEAFQNSDKSYVGVIRLGLATDTDDICGRHLSSVDVDSKLAAFSNPLEQIIDRFEGEQDQLPPSYSAIKVDGLRNYERARSGEIFNIQKRRVSIYFDDLIMQSSESLRFEVRCSKGTYIRSLARDIGEFLGCGACIESLRRTESGAFSIKSSKSVRQLQQRVPELPQLSMAKLVSHLPRVEFKSDDIMRLQKGIQAPLKSVQIRDGDSKLAAMFSTSGDFGGLIERKGADNSWKLKFVV